jgi:benzodiazapine receptor
VMAALALFFVQLALNATWSFVFFGLRQPGLALLEILALLAAIIATMTSFAQLSRPACWLMTPYAAWVSYATFLNFGIWRLNRGAP